jgi:hypothetical protein
MFARVSFLPAARDLSDLYKAVLRHSYGDRAAEVHPFVVTESTALHTLIQLNVVLLGIPLVAVAVTGRVRFFQMLRAHFSVLVFSRLKSELERETLATSTSNRKVALVLQLALLFEQVVALRGDIPAAPIACARSEVHEEMRLHLIQYLAYYIDKLTKDNFKGPNLLMECIETAKLRGHVPERFWDILEVLIPCIPLVKPPKIWDYVDMGWENCGVDDGAYVNELFTSLCSIDGNRRHV